MNSLILKLVLFFSFSIQAQDNVDDLPPPPEEKISRPTVEEQVSTATTDASVQTDSIPNQSKPLTLKQAIELGLRENSEEKVRVFTNSLYDIKLQNNFESFWFPQMSMYLTSENQKLHRIWEGPQFNGPLIGGGATKSPDTQMGTIFGDYTLFNWGKDHLSYLNNKQYFERQKEFLNEKRRSLKHDIIKAYFELSKNKKEIEIYREQLRHATFIYRLAREKVDLRKIGKQEYYEARAEFLLAQAEYHESLSRKGELETNLANLIGDELNSTYNVVDELEFKKMKLMMADAITSAIGANSYIKNQYTAMQIGQREYDIVTRENLPLPRIHLNLGTWSNRFSKNSSYSTYETTAGSRNIDMLASVNATWTLLGEGGFLNHRLTQASFLQKKIEETKYYDLKRQVEMEVRGLMKSLIALEAQMDVAKLRLENANKHFDATLDNYTGGVARFNELRDALYNLKISSREFEVSKFEHLKKKINLANVMGVEDFPAERFENLTKSSSGGSK